MTGKRKTVIGLLAALGVMSGLRLGVGAALPDLLRRDGL